MKHEHRTKSDGHHTGTIASIPDPCVIAVSHHLPVKVAKERVQLLLEYFRRDPSSGKVRTQTRVEWNRDVGSTELRLGLDYVAPCHVKVDSHWVRLAIPKVTPGNTRDKISTDLTTMLCYNPQVPASTTLWKCHHDRAAQAVTGYSAS